MDAALGAPRVPNSNHSITSTQSDQRSNSRISHYTVKQLSALLRLDYMPGLGQARLAQLLRAFGYTESALSAEPNACALLAFRRNYARASTALIVRSTSLSATAFVSLHASVLSIYSDYTHSRPATFVVLQRVVWPCRWSLYCHRRCSKSECHRQERRGKG